LKGQLVILEIEQSLAGQSGGSSTHWISQQQQELKGLIEKLHGRQLKNTSALQQQEKLGPVTGTLCARAARRTATEKFQMNWWVGEAPALDL
jgi:hypothetical protein